MTIVFFDTETGGLQPQHPTIQLAAVAVNEKWAHLETFERKITFDEKTADHEALKINHYDPALWKDAIPEARVVSEFSAFLKKHSGIEMISKRTGAPYSVARLAGHNAATFDGPRLKDMYTRYQAFLPAHPLVLCTLQRAMWYFHERGIKIKSLSLGSVAEHFGIAVPESHDAMADCLAAIGIAQAMAVPVEVAA